MALSFFLKVVNHYFSEGQWLWVPDSGSKNRDGSFLKGLKREGRNCKYFLFSIYYSRQCPSTERISPSPESSIFLYPLLSLSILPPVAQQCLPLSIFCSRLCLFFPKWRCKGIETAKDMIHPDGKLIVYTNSTRRLNKYGAATVWLQPTVFPLSLASSWALRFDIACSTPDSPLLMKVSYIAVMRLIAWLCGGLSTAMQHGGGFVLSHSWWSLAVVGVCSFL